MRWRRLACWPGLHTHNETGIVIPIFPGESPHTDCSRRLPLHRSQHEKSAKGPTKDGYLAWEYGAWLSPH